MNAGKTPLTEEYLRAHTVGELRPLSSPIWVVAYDPEWPRRFEAIAGEIKSALGDRALRLEHVGSTSVPGLPAKAIIDVVLTVADSSREHDYVTALEELGYKLQIREPEWFEHRMLKGPEGNINLHVFSRGCEEIERMLAFRDWLRTHPEDRELYARTKETLAQQEWKYTQNYADAKTAVIQKIMSRMRDSEGESQA